METAEKRIRIIKAHKRLLPHAARLCLRSWVVRPSIDKVLDRLEKDESTVLVAIPEEDDYPVMGVTTATIKGSIAFIEEHIVAVPFQGRGLGRALMDGLVNHVGLRGVKVIIARCVRGKHADVSWLEQYGFEVIKVETASNHEGFADGQVVLTARYELPW